MNKTKSQNQTLVPNNYKPNKPKTSMNKKALSNMIAYVLLISITIALSMMVYGWLKGYVTGEEIETCSDNVNIIISNYECTEGPTGNLTVTLKNKGLFSTDGYILRVHNRPNAEFGFYTLNKTGSKLSPGQSIKDTYKFPLTKDKLETITLVEVQPFIMKDGKISCETYASQKVVCK